MLLLLICMNWMGLIRFVLTGEVSPTTSGAISVRLSFFISNEACDLRSLIL